LNNDEQTWVEETLTIYKQIFVARYLIGFDKKYVVAAVSFLWLEVHLFDDDMTVSAGDKCVPAGESCQ